MFFPHLYTLFLSFFLFCSLCSFAFGFEIIILYLLLIWNHMRIKIIWEMKNTKIKKHTLLENRKILSKLNYDFPLFLLYLYIFFSSSLFFPLLSFFEIYLYHYIFSCWKNIFFLRLTLYYNVFSPNTIYLFCFRFPKPKDIKI